MEQSEIIARTQKFDLPRSKIAEYGIPTRNSDNGYSMGLPVKYTDGTYDVLWCYKDSYHSVIDGSKAHIKEAFSGVMEMPIVSCSFKFMYIHFVTERGKGVICIGVNEHHGCDTVDWPDERVKQE